MKIFPYRYFYIMLGAVVFVPYGIFLIMYKYVEFLRDLTEKLFDTIAKKANEKNSGN